MQPPSKTQQRFSLLLKRWSHIQPTLAYWMETEVHVYGFSIAANVLLAFFPFLITLLGFCVYVLRWPSGAEAVYFAINEYLPGSRYDDLGSFLRRNLSSELGRNGPLQIGSILLLLFTANGVFEPMEVALNKAWGIHKHRNFLANQVISLTLIFVCGVLAFLSISLTALSFDIVQPLVAKGSWWWRNIGAVTLNIATLPITILTLFLIYWLLPNRKIKPIQVFPAAVIVGGTIEVLKYVFLLIYPWMFERVTHEYGPFKHSVTIILVSFVVSMIVLAGAEASARIERTVIAPQESAMQAAKANASEGTGGPGSSTVAGADTPREPH